MASLGSLVVSLGLDAADFVSGLTKNEYRAKQFGASMSNSVAAGVLKAEIALRAIDSAARIAGEAFQALVHDAANFKDLEETTGASAESIASLAVAAATAGVNINDVGGALNKLTKNLVGVDDESKGAGAALAALGLTVKEFKSLDPASQYEAVGKALGGFADGSEKVAIAQALFGKQGAEQLKVFKALEEQGGRTKILTQEQIELADAYADRQAKTTAELKLYAQAAATKALPAFNDLTIAAKEFIGQVIGIDKATGQLGANTAVQSFADGAVDALAFVVDAGRGVVQVFQTVGTSVGAGAAAVAAVARGDIAGAIQIAKEARAEIDSILSAESFRDKVARARAARLAEPPRTEAAPDNRPKLDISKLGNTAGAKDDPTKKLLDNALKEQELAIRREQELMQSRNKFLDLVNDQNLISIKDYYAARQVIVEEGTAKQIAALDKEIAALQKYRDAPGRKKTERADTDGKINELLERRIDLERKAGETGLEFAIRQAREQENLERSIEEVNAQVLELTGNLKQAAAIKFDQQNKGLRNRFTAEGNQDALQALGTLRAYTIAQGEYNQRQAEAQRITDTLQNSEERIAIARQLGSIGEFDALRQLGEARRAAVAQLESIVAAQEEVAKSSGNPVLIANAEKARLALERLRAEADVLASTFRTMFKDSAASAFEGFINGTLSAKDAFRQFIGDVVSQINRITAQQLSDAIFGKGGTFDIGKIFSSGSGGGDFFSSIGGFFSSFFGGGLAGGGTAERGRFYEVNERRPELLSVNGRDFLMMGSQRGKVIPNPQVSGGRSQVNNITVNVPETTTRISGTQLAADIQRRIAAGSRNL